MPCQRGSSQVVTEKKNNETKVWKMGLKLLKRDENIIKFNV